MSVNHAPRIVTDGLVMYIDGLNTLSYPGEPTTNLIPTPLINTYPTINNEWGTYNTNQYNNNTYFSIGTISDVTSNIITTSSAHPLRSFDVVTPQTTGGGVTAGTNYFVKKLSSTQFTLHAYNSSQDGSQGYMNSATGTYKVHDSIALDQRISVSNSSFPTMWWGPPHLPNSGIVKEIRNGGYNFISDCIRLHFYRPDGVTDGMAYGPYPAVVGGQIYTASFYTRSVDANAVGRYLSYQNYCYGGVAPDSTGFQAYLGPVGIWTRQSYQFTPTYNGWCISYWFINTGPCICDVANIQIEQKTHPTNFTTGTRGSTVATNGGWKDLIGTNNADLTNMTYDSISKLYFNGTSSYFQIDQILTTPITINCFLKYTDQNKSLNTWFNTSPHTVLAISSNRTGIGDTYVYIGNGSTWLSAPSINSSITTTANVWHCLTFVSDGSGSVLYINGSNAGTSQYSPSGWGSYYHIGRIVQSGEYLKGYIDSLQIYNKALTQPEVLQNYNALKGRFGL